MEEGVRGHWLNITILPHARQRMRERKITESQVRAVLERPAHQYPGNLRADGRGEAGGQRQARHQERSEEGRERLTRPMREFL